jgi:general secretion pathway protein K
MATSKISDRSRERKRAVLCRRQRGSALLAVLWLSAALSAIAFSLATTVRGETERASTSVDGLRGYYLAAGGIDRASVELLWGVKNPDKRLIPRGALFVDYHFASGDVRVEFLPEAGKLDINKATPEVIYKVNMALGLEPERAREIAMAIDDWRRPGTEGSTAGSGSGIGPSFRVLHASIQEIEELLQVRGITPDIFYGSYVPAPEGSSNGPRLQARPGLIDCFSVFGTKDRVDVNTAQPAVLAAIGLTPMAVNAVLERRRVEPFTEKSLGDFLQMIDAPGALLRVEGNSIVTMRATARLRTGNGQLSDMRRTVGAQVKYMPPGYDSPIHILRWYDSTWVNN